MLRKDGTFEEDIQCIVHPRNNKGAIYISNLEAASNPATLQKYSIKAVVTAAKGKNLVNAMPTHIQYLYIPAVDHQSFDISQYFDVFMQLMDQELPRTNVLVHCMAGVSRSVTLVIAYLMKTRELTYFEAYNYVKSKRKIINPNSAFISQLKTYERALKSKQKMAQSDSTNGSWYGPNSNGKQPVIDILKDETQYNRCLKAKIQVLFKTREGLSQKH